MKYKKIYIEITNNCNLSCSFCIHNKREPRFMNLEDFKNILAKIDGYTRYIYLHVLGEPLLHPLINEFIDEARKKFFVNITTNGYLISKIKNNKNIHQLNISLHSNDGNPHYLENIFECADILKDHTYINYRLWAGDNENIKQALEKKYNCKINGSMHLEDHIYLDIESEFKWPNLTNDIYKEKGTCYGLKNHFGVLVDGSIVPCCLDGNGEITLGNIFRDDLDEILNSERAEKMRQGFKNKILVEELCKHCGFIERLEKNEMSK